MNGKPVGVVSNASSGPVEYRSIMAKPSPEMPFTVTLPIYEVSV